MLMRYIFCLTLWCAGLLFPSPALRAARSGDGGAFKAVWSAVAPQAPKHEVRAVWLTTIGGIDWPHSYSQSRFSMERQQAELCRLLDLYHRAGINTVLMQTRIRATTIYDAPSRASPAAPRATTRCASPSTSATSGAWNCTRGWSPYPWASGTARAAGGCDSTCRES